MHDEIDQRKRMRRFPGRSFEARVQNAMRSHLDAAAEQQPVKHLDNDPGTVSPDTMEQLTIDLLERARTGIHREATRRK